MNWELLSVIIGCLSDIETSIAEHKGNAQRMTAYCGDIIESVYSETMSEREAINWLRKARDAKWDGEMLNTYFADLPEVLRPKE